MSEKLFPSIPAIGSDKQDGFARILAHKLALSLPAFEADIKAATKRDTLVLPPFCYTKDEAGSIIDYLLAKCKLAGIEIASRKGNGRRGSGRRGEPQPEPQPGGGAKTLAQFSAVELSNELQSRGVPQLSGVSSDLMIAELQGRGKWVSSVAEALEKAHLNSLCNELEKRGYPGEAIKRNPDLLGQAGLMAELVDTVFHGIAKAPAMFQTSAKWRDEARAALINAGLLTE